MSSDRIIPLGRRAFAGDSLKYLPSMILPAVSGMLVLPAMTRSFPQAAYGNYVIANATLTLLQLVANTWLNSTIIRFYTNAEAEGDVRRLHTTAFVIILLESLASALLCWSITLALRPSLGAELVMLLLLVPIQVFASNLFMLPLQTMRARRQIGIYNTLTVARSFLPPFAGIGLGIWMGHDIVGVMIGSAAAYWLLLPISYWLGLTSDQRPAFRFFDSAWARRLIDYGTPLVPALVMVNVLDMSGRFIIGAYRGTVEAAIYGAAYNMASLPMQLVTLAVTAAAAPLLVPIWEAQGRQAAERFVTFITRVFSLIALPAALGIMLLADDLIVVFSTAEYAGGAIIVPWVAGGGLLLGFQWIAQRGMILANRTRRIMAVYLLVGAANIAANIILVPRYGYTAAGWTTFWCYAFLLMLIAWGSSPHLTWRPDWTSLIRSIVGCGAMAAVLLIMPEIRWGGVLVRLVIEIGAGILAYGAVLLLLGEFPARRILGWVREWRAARAR